MQIYSRILRKWILFNFVPATVVGWLFVFELSPVILWLIIVDFDSLFADTWLHLVDFAESESVEVR